MVGSAVARLVLSSEPMNTGSIMPKTITRASLWESEVIGAGLVRASTGAEGLPCGWFLVRGGSRERFRAAPRVRPAAAQD